jgi:RNA recognition motif-containing protein
MKIYVGNIARESRENDVKNLFETYGTVDSVVLIRDNYTNLLKGFGFVEMSDDEAAKKAISELDGQLFNDRPLNVSVAKPRNENGGNHNRRGGYNRDRRYGSH